MREPGLDRRGGWESRVYRSKEEWSIGVHVILVLFVLVRVPKPLKCLKGQSDGSKEEGGHGCKREGCRRSGIAIFDKRGRTDTLDHTPIESLDRSTSRS